MVLDSELSDIFGLLKKVFDYFRGTKPQKVRPTKRRRRPSGSSGDIKTQSPLRSGWTNLGGFTPGVYLNEMHKNGHYGVDMQATRGTPVYPFAVGTVLSAGSSSGNSAGGITITILHPNNMMTYYAHLSSINVSKGDEVNVNTQIGTVGNTGNAQHSSPHLHFEVHENVNPKNPTASWNGTAVNPASFMSVPKYNQKIEPSEKAVAETAIDSLIKISSIYEETINKLS
jgi:murein DD-endopeptidase MepM/ murein hydrolase activator NlpD